MLYPLIYDPEEKIWIFEFSLGVCSTELRSLVSSLKYLVSNEREVILGGIRLGGSAIVLQTSSLTLRRRFFTVEHRPSNMGVVLVDLY